MFSLFKWDYSPMTQPQVQKIIHKSVSHGSCIRCALSFVQCFEAELYACPSRRIVQLLKEGDLLLAPKIADETLQNGDDQKNHEEKLSSSTTNGENQQSQQESEQSLIDFYGDHEGRCCVVCRGIFQDRHLFDTIPSTVSNLSSKRFSFETFGVSIYLHHEFMVRDHLMTVFARDGIYHPTIASSTSGSSSAAIVVINSDRKRILRDVLIHVLTLRLNSDQQQLRLSNNDNSTSAANFKRIHHRKHQFDVHVEIKTNDGVSAEELTVTAVVADDQSESALDASVNTGDNELYQSRKRRKESKELAKKRDTLCGVVKEFNLNRLKEKYTCPPTLPENLSPDQMLILTTDVTHSPIYFSGRYLKLMRGLPQSPWIIKGNPSESKEGSLEEYIGNQLLKACNCESYKFDSAGREDIDVRMLGQGRPFVFTMIKPVTTKLSDAQVLELEGLINQKYEGIVQVNNLKLSFDTSASKTMREGAVEKKKKYRCVVWYSGILEDDRIQYMESLKDLKIYQNTPVRVLHRRAEQIRERIIHELKCVEKLNDHYMVLDLTTSAGTYVKEFVHSDFGRTKPSLGTLLADNQEGLAMFKDAHILQLDVMDIEMED